MNCTLYGVGVREHETFRPMPACRAFAMKHQINSADLFILSLASIQKL